MPSLVPDGLGDERSGNYEPGSSRYIYKANRGSYQTHGFISCQSPKTEDLVEKYDGKTDKILNLPYDDARKKLTSIKGIGPKTADVFLMAIKGERVLPVDVHIFRIMKRLGIAGERDDYESLRAKLESAIPPEERMKAHLILIEFGRQICSAQNPKCEECPIRRYCEVTL